MTKIGFIDYHIDEWHANNYPNWIRESSRKNNFEIAYAWEDSQGEGLRSLEKWCEDFNVTPAKSIEQLVEDCDGIIVLSPSNPEMHEKLADIPLQSGKPVYIDKPFAPTRKVAEALFTKAAKHGTPMFSSSALRFGSEIQTAVKETLAGKVPNFALSTGGGTSFEEYSIHQIEMLVMVMGTGAKRVMQCGAGQTNQMLIDYGSERRCSMTLRSDLSFQITASNDNAMVAINSMGDFFPGLIETILEFFETKCAPVKQEETIEIVSIMEAGIKALHKKDCWIAL